MDLELLHRSVSDTISALRFADIWPGFAPLKFALFQDDTCFFDGRYIEKTDAFCANTSIVYEGEQIATWMVGEELPLPVLCSKLVHEMFHGFQALQGWNCWPNELEALFKYEYNADHLRLKLCEDQLMLDLLERFDSASLRKLLALRKLRGERFPEQFAYEIRYEEIEGTANYVEWQVLKQLDPQKADELTTHMRAVLTAPEQLFPIRISCYYTGALMVHAQLSAGIYRFEADERPAMLPVWENMEPFRGELPGEEALFRQVSDAVGKFYAETESIIQAALEQNEVVLRGPLELGFVNIYNARFHRGFLTTTFFLIYRENGAEKMLPGNYVVKMRDEKTIDSVYRWN